MKTNKQWMILGGLVVVGLTTALGVAVTQHQSKVQAEEALTQAEQDAVALREKLQKTESDLAALARTAASRTITPATTPAPATPPIPLATDPGLQQQLQEKDQQIAALQEQLAQTQQQRPGQPRGREDWQARMEQMRTENPEEYQRIQQEREQRRQEFTQRTNDRFAFFAAIPTDGLSEEYLTNHQAFLDRMKFFNDAMAQMTADPTSEASQELRQQMRENMQGTREMVEMERDVLLTDLLSNLGVEGNATTEAIDYIRYVDEMTSMGGMWGRGGGPPGGGGDRGGNRGGDGGRPGR